MEVVVEEVEEEEAAVVSVAEGVEVEVAAAATKVPQTRLWKPDMSSTTANQSLSVDGQ